MIQYMHDMNGDATATGTDRPGTGGETGRGTVIVGESLGLSLGLSLGSTLGETLGESLGEPLGESLGLSVGETVGYFVGAVVTSLKSTVTRYLFIEDLHNLGSDMTRRYSTASEWE